MPLLKVFRNPWSSVVWNSSSSAAVHVSCFQSDLHICQIYISEVPKDTYLPAGEPESVMTIIQFMWEQSALGKLSAQCPGFP
jgi:hypothetical protein